MYFVSVNYCPLPATPNSIPKSGIVIEGDFSKVRCEAGHVRVGDDTKSYEGAEGSMKCVSSGQFEGNSICKLLGK